MSDLEKEHGLFRTKKEAGLANMADAFGIKPGDPFYNAALLEACWDIIPPDDNEQGYRNRLQADEMLKAIWRVYDAGMTIVSDNDEWRSLRDRLKDMDWNTDSEDPSDEASEADLDEVLADCADYASVPYASREIIADLTRQVLRVFSFSYSRDAIFCEIEYRRILEALVAALPP